MKELTKEDKIEKILSIVENKGVTAYELAKSTGLNESGLNRLLKGEVKNPHITTIDKLYEYLYCTNTVSSINERISGIKTLQDISDFIIDFEKELLEIPNHRLWRKTKIQEGVIKVLRSDIE